MRPVGSLRRASYRWMRWSLRRYVLEDDEGAAEHGPGRGVHRKGHAAVRGIGEGVAVGVARRAARNGEGIDDGLPRSNGRTVDRDGLVRCAAGAAAREHTDTGRAVVDEQ